MIQQLKNDCRVVRKPTFLILGAPKCGTTTLFQVLNEHPDITLSRPKEPLFFEAEFELGMEYYWQKYFAHWNGESAIGEARASKLFLPYVATRIRASLPDVKLIAIVRNPIDRVFSHWWMRYCNGKEKLNLREALKKNLEAIQKGRTLDGEIGQVNWLSHISMSEETLPFYLEIGYYAQHISTYLKLFPSSQVKILFFDDLCHQPERLFAEVSSYLAVSPDVPLRIRIQLNSAPTRTALALHKIDQYFNVPKLVPVYVRLRLKSIAALLGNAPKIDSETRVWLSEHYFEHNRQLEKITRRDLSHWDKVDD